MTYKMPRGVTYTEMAIYIDNHIRDERRDECLIFEYLYHLSYMLARKGSYFHKSE